MYSDLVKRFSDFFREKSNQDLVDIFNKEVDVKGWVGARGAYLIALNDEFVRRNIDVGLIADFTNSGEATISLKYKVKILGDRLVYL